MDVLRRELQEWQSNLQEIVTNHIKATVRTTTAHALSYSAQIAALKATQDGRIPNEDEADLVRYQEQAAVFLLLPQVLAVMVRVEAHLDAQRASVDDMRVSHQVAAERLQLIISYWQWFRIVLIMLLTLMIIGVLMLLILLANDAQILRGVGATWLGGH